MGDTISSLVFRPPKPTPIDPNDYFYLDVDITSPLYFLFVRRRGARHTILFSHGNAEDLGMMYKRMKDLALVLCVNVMAYDYTGYGLKRNVPSENMVYRNIEAAYTYLTQTRNIPPRNIILYGRSLGSGPSCYLAAKTALMGESVGGLILHSPFLSVYKVVADVWGMDVRGDMFNNEKRAGNVRCPTLIIHGKEDEVVPFWHAPRLLAAIPPEFRAHPFYVDNLGHNHIESRERGNYIQAITEFLMKYVPPVDDDSGSSTGALDRWLHVNNSKKKHSSFSQCKTQQNDLHVNIIPEHERATADEAKQSDTSFYINQTWMRHAKVICAEVFSDNIICNSALTVTDWSGGSSRDGTGSRDGSGGPTGKGSKSSDSAKQRHPGDKYSCYDDARDDEDEFSPWTMDSEGRQEQQNMQDKICMSRQGSTTNNNNNNINNNPCSATKFKRSQSDVPNRDSKINEMVEIHQPQKKPPLNPKHSNKSSSMPASMETGPNLMKIKLTSSTRRRSGGRGAFLGFRK
ncbi:hypothetical protein ACHAWX_003836 [Stephanocyclus meneghinianus]